MKTIFFLCYQEKIKSEDRIVSIYTLHNSDTSQLELMWTSFNYVNIILKIPK